MRFLRTNTAVLVTVGPFYDKTDGVTIETALTITNERITLTADTDGGSAPTNILDNVTGATSGTSNDLNYISGNDAGMMQLELSAADTNRVGRMMLSITDAANHVPVFHEFMVMPALVYDTFFAASGGATFPAATLASTTNITAATGVDITKILGTAISTPATAGILDVNVKNIDNDAASASGTVTFPNATLASTTNITAGTITTATNLTNLPAITNNWLTAAGIAASALNGKGDWNIGKTGYALSAAGVQAIWDALTSALTAVGSIGKKLADWVIGTTQTGDSFARLGAPVGASISADIAAVQADTDNIQTRLPAALVSGRIDASVGAMAANVMTAAAAAADLTTELQAGLATAASLATTDGKVDAIKAQTDNLPSDPADESLVIAATDAIMTRLGVPVGASVSADVAAVQSDTDNIQTRIPAALISGRIDATVGAMQADVLTSTALAASAVTEIQTGLSTLDAAAVRAAIGIASANLDTQLAAISGYIDTEVSAIKAKTDNLPVDPATETTLAALAATATEVKKLLRNKRILDPGTGVETLYDDDGSVLYTRDVFGDAAGSVPYADGIVDRVERFT